ncbi:MAG: hypothetical protein IJX22_05005 [Opitutales bacterium]|nr:hypothetical protein [Opitutales bacterium]
MNIKILEVCNLLKQIAKMQNRSESEVEDEYWQEQINACKDLLNEQD